MRKDSIFIFGFSVLITIGLVGGAYYMSVVRPVEVNIPRASPKSTLPTPKSQPTGSSTPAVGQSNQILKCVDPEIGEFFTNAKDCESADLKNRLSHAQVVEKVDYISPTANEARKELKSAADETSKKSPSIRKVAQSVPDNLSVTCKFAVGRALEIERMLSAADDPRESIWRENYCRWVGETRSEDCQLASDTFFYGDLCRRGS